MLLVASAWFQKQMANTWHSRHSKSKQCYGFSGIDGKSACVVQAAGVALHISKAIFKEKNFVKFSLDASIWLFG